MRWVVPASSQMEVMVVGPAMPSTETGTPRSSAPWNRAWTRSSYWVTHWATAVLGPFITIGSEVVPVPVAAPPHPRKS